MGGAWALVWGEKEWGVVNFDLIPASVASSSSYLGMMIMTMSDER